MIGISTLISDKLRSSYENVDQFIAFFIKTSLTLEKKLAILNCA